MRLTLGSGRLHGFMDGGGGYAELMQGRVVAEFGSGLRR